MRCRFPRLFAIGLALQLLSSAHTRADLTQVLPELGDLQCWSVFSLGNDMARNAFAGNTYVQGDVGGAGAGQIALRDTATIYGNVYYSSNGSLTTTPDTTITGLQIRNQDAQLENDARAAIAASHQAASFRQNVSAPTNLELSRNKDFTLTGAPGDAVVLKLGNFALTGHSTFTLEGTASTTFIINVTKQFALSGNARIVLSGGVQWSNVLFNICSKDSAVSLSGNSTFAGILMANRRTVQLADSATVDGEIIANRIRLTKGSVNDSITVGHPPLVSP